MRRKDFVSHPDDVALISSIGDITVKPPSNTRLVDNFKVTCSPDDYFKKSIKKDVCLRTTLKYGKICDTWRRKTLFPDRVQDKT